MAFEFIMGIINRCSWLLEYYNMQTYILEFPAPLCYYRCNFTLLRESLTALLFILYILQAIAR